MASWSAAPMLRILFIRSSSRAAVCQQQQHRQLSSSKAAQPPVCYEDDQHNITAASIPSAVWECLHQLRAAGHEVLLVGGAVRDLLLQCGEPKDYDILTSAQLKQVKELFNKARLIGKNFPICQLDRDGFKIDISSMHTKVAKGGSSGATAGSNSNTSIPADVAEHLLGADAAPGRGRRSSILSHFRQQHCTSWAAARRCNATARDFTVNALLYDPFQAVLFDYVAGLKDVQHKLLRCVGDPGRKFAADPACLLRAVRCAARTGLQLEPTTAAAVQQHSHLVTSLNPQRLTAELTAMLGYGAAAASLLLLQQVQLMQHLLPLHETYSGRMWPESSSRKSSKMQQQQGARRCPTAAMQPKTDTASAACAAGSRLGQFLLQRRDTTHSLLSNKPRAEDVTVAHGKQHNLLLKVAAALDQLVSVKQPAHAEVLLACLTAPLLVERLHEAVGQLAQQVAEQQQETRPQLQQAPLPQQQEQRQVAQYTTRNEALWPYQPEQQQQQQHEQRVPYASELFASQVLLPQQVQHAQQLQLQRQTEKLCEQHVHNMCSSTAAAWQQAQVASAARAFSSSSSSGGGGGGSNGMTQLPGAVPSRLSTAAVAQELLNGASFGDVLHRQAVQLASEVCAVQQSPYQDSTLFGVSTPELAADLLATHIAVCKSHRVQQQQQQRGGRLGTGRNLDSSSSSSLRMGSSSTSSRTGSNRQYSSNNNWLGFDSHMPPPRTNKQYRRMMQAQQQQAAAEMAGSLGSIPSPDAMLLAAAFAANSDNALDSSDFERSSDSNIAAGGRGARQQQQLGQCAAVVHGVALSHEEYMLHQVLMTACAGFDDLEQQVAELQVLVAKCDRQLKQ